MGKLVPLRRRTLRFYQAVMTRCIPIIIADDIEFPYESEINYSVGLCTS
jgi:hypothetical protein